MERLLLNGPYPGIATHDEDIINHAVAFVASNGIAAERYEFQMLLGVDEELRSILIDRGHRLRGYVPFGSDWYQYSVRRLRENPEIAGHVARFAR